MAALHIFHATARRLARAEYDRMAQLGFFEGERVELVHGMVVRMAPIGPPHSEIVDRLGERLVRGAEGRVRVRIQQPLLACDESEPEPDVAVVASGSYRERHPDRALLVVEVAETSLEYDRETKAPLYAASGVDEYWIVDVAARRLEVRTDPVGGQYTRTRVLGSGEGVAPRALPEVAITVDELFG